jgi:PucR C-terminal helix-turn-helix domain
VRVWESLEMPAERLEARPGADADADADGTGEAGWPGDANWSGDASWPGDGGPEPPLHEQLLASVPAPVLCSFRDRLLGPLREYDDRHNAELLATLRSFLACDGSWSACASLMYVHVNTVRYRISRVEALTGRDLSALADRVDFFLALRGA